MGRTKSAAAGVVVALLGHATTASAFVPVPLGSKPLATGSAFGRQASSRRTGAARRKRAVAPTMARGSHFRAAGGESKRQARVAQVVTQELAAIIRDGHMVKTLDIVADELRKKISIVDVVMSPDLASAKVFVSVYGDTLEKREAYSWCVRNVKQIRGALAARARGMKRVPELFFKRTDIGAAVDIMSLIDKVAAEDAAAAGGRGDDFEGGFDFSDDYEDGGFDDDGEEEEDGFDAADDYSVLDTPENHR